MKKRLNLLVMLVCLLALSLTFIGCPTDSDDDDDSGGGNTPSELIGKWKFSGGGYDGMIAFEFTASQYNAYDIVTDDGPIHTEASEDWWDVESVTGKKIKVSLFGGQMTNTLCYSYEIDQGGKLTFNFKDENGYSNYNGSNFYLYEQTFVK